MDKSNADKYFNELESDLNISKDVKFLLAKLQTKANEKIKSDHHNLEQSSMAVDECPKEKELKIQIDIANKILETIELKEFINSFGALKLDSKRLLSTQTQAKM